MQSNPHAEWQQLQQILDCLDEGVLVLDPDGTIAWASHSALAMHDCTRLDELGSTAAGYRQTFALKSRGSDLLEPQQYPADRLMAGETFHDLVLEAARTDGAPFHRVFRFRGLSVADAGVVKSLALVIQDVSALHDAEARFETTFAAKPAPALICRLSDLRYVKVNAGFLDMTGYDRDTMLAGTIYDIDVLEGSSRRDESILNLRGGRTIAQQEAMLRLPDNQRKLVIVAGQPIKIGGEACMLFSFSDIDAHRKSGDALRQSEERFSSIFRLAPIPIAVARLPDFTTVDTNEAYDQSLISPDAPSAGDTPLQHRREKLRKILREMLATGHSVRALEFEWFDHDGQPIDCLIHADSILIDSIPHALCVVQNISERRRSESELLSAIDTVMRDASWFGRSVLDKLARLRQPGRQESAGVEELTPRERQVLGLICEGLSNSDIATRMRLSQNTVRNHVAALYDKIDVKNRGAAIVWGRERGIVGHAGTTAETPRARRED